MYGEKSLPLPLKATSGRISESARNRTSPGEDCFSLLFLALTTKTHHHIMSGVGRRRIVARIRSSNSDGEGGFSYEIVGGKSANRRSEGIREKEGGEEKEKTAVIRMEETHTVRESQN